MSLYFLVNNFVFAFGMLGAIVFLTAAWLSFDSYRLKPDPFVLSRSIGFALGSVWQLIAALSLGSDVLLYIGFAIFILGITCIAASFLKKNELVMHSILVIPSFDLWSSKLHIISTILLGLVAWLSFRQYKQDQNRTWIPFSASFALIGCASFIRMFVNNLDQTNFFFIASLVIEVVGFGWLGYWIWQYMRLRIKESFVMIAIGVTFALATIVTLAFSTILLSRITHETSVNLVTDVKVLDFAISSLEEESLAKATLVAGESEIVEAFSNNDSQSLEQLAEKFLEKYKIGFLTLTDPTGNVIVRANALSRRGDSLAGERAFEEASHKNTFVTIEASPVEGLSIRAGAPIVKGSKILGTVVAGYPLDNAFVDRMKRVTGLEMFVYKDTTSIAATAFATDGTTRLVGTVLDDAAIRESVFGGAKTVTADTGISGERFQVSYSPITNADDKVVGMLSAAKHQQDIVNIANATNRLTLITVILILLVLALPIYFVAKKFGTESGGGAA